ncbi:MAG: hypothetical protein AAF483_17810 [Planctomycetota bacterium]
MKSTPASSSSKPLSLQISGETMLAIVAASAILVAGASRPFILGVSFVAMPILMMAIAITCPKDGTQLNPEGKWPLFLLGKTFMLAVGGLCAFGVFSSLSPYWGDRILRGIQGDLSAQRLRIYFDADPGLADRMNSETFELHDQKGYVGNVTKADGGFFHGRISATIAANREPAVYRTGYEVEVQAGRKLFLHPVKTPGALILPPVVSLDTPFSNGNAQLESASAEVPLAELNSTPQIPQSQSVKAN